ncbi:putative eka-like protein [Erysiphe necator]|uniref:Putative eka-like protein n=1 Tax=Uncinula necator TaxID=52586 RepID=A0A0B1P0Y2_UNCNE|nr:putative eka-like protein [Erysiphe necator]
MQEVNRNKESQIASHRDNSATSVSDKRLFDRLPQGHEWRKLSPAGIREVIVKKLHISPSLIGRIKPVHSGFALSPCSAEAREEILKAENGLFLSGAKLETATNWVSVLVPTVPAFVNMEQGVVEVSKDMLSDEIERVSSMRPAHLKLYGRNNLESPHRTWLAYFPKAPRGGFRVFDESGVLRPYKKQKPTEFCERCNGHHPSKNCSRAPSCANCGSTYHTADIGMAATKCRNCGGPHRADSRRCLARPTRSGSPTKEQLKTYRQMGEREYNAVQRAKVAEEKAASIERTEIDLTGSQASEVSMTVDNSQATPVEDTTTVASRL